MQSDEKLHKSRARDLFKHKWESSNKNYCIELRKKKRIDLIKDKRNNSMNILNSNLDSEILQSIENDLVSLQNIIDKDMKDLLERMKKCLDDLRLIRIEWFLAIFDRIIMILNQGLVDLAEMVGVLCVICEKVEKFDEESGNIVCEKMVGGLEINVFRRSIEKLCQFLRVVFEDVKIKDVGGFLEYLRKVYEGNRSGNEFLVKVLLALSKNNHICRILPNDLFKLVINGLVSLRDEMQMDSVLIVTNFSSEEDSSKNYLIEIDILSILCHLLESSPPRTKSQVYQILSNLLQTESHHSLCQLLTPSLCQSLLTQISLNPAFQSQSQILINLLYLLTEKSIIFNLNILDCLINQNIFPILSQQIQDNPEHLGLNFLNLIDNLLYLSTNTLQTQAFIDSGCYFALELYSSQSKSKFSNQVKYILSSYFES